MLVACRLAQRACLVGIVKIDELPVRRFCDRGVVEFYRIPPDRKEIFVEAFLQNGREFVERKAEIDTRFIHARDRDKATLSSLGAKDSVHTSFSSYLLKISEAYILQELALVRADLPYDAYLQPVCAFWR